jgi:hypothetical protein
VLNIIHNIQRKFLWKETKEGRNSTLVKWENICKTKLLGGLGLRDSCILNEAMGAKIRWRWLNHPRDI